MGYAFINFVAASDVLTFYTRWRDKRWIQFSSRKRCELAYGRVQGRAALEEHFKTSRSLLSNPPHCRPLVITTPGPGDGPKPEGPVAEVVHAPMLYPDPNGVPANTYMGPTCGAFTLHLHGTPRVCNVVHATLGPPTPREVREAMGALASPVCIQVNEGVAGDEPRGAKRGGRALGGQGTRWRSAVRGPTRHMS